MTDADVIGTSPWTFDHVRFRSTEKAHLDLPDIFVFSFVFFEITRLAADGKDTS